MSLKVEYDKKAQFIVEEKLPEFTVHIFAEDEQPMAAAKASSISLKLWKMDAKSQNTPPSRASNNINLLARLYFSAEELLLYRQRPSPRPHAKC